MMGDGPNWGMMGGWGGYGYGPLHFLIWIVTLIAIVILILWLLRSFAWSRMHYTPPRRSSGLDVLEERYARGEINRDEYLQKKGDIDGKF